MTLQVDARKVRSSTLGKKEKLGAGLLERWAAADESLPYMTALYMAHVRETPEGNASHTKLAFSGRGHLKLLNPSHS